MADPLSQRTDPVYQKDGQKYTHTSTLTSLQLLSSLSEATQTLFKPPPSANPAYILTTPSTIFHAQGGGQPSDTGTMTVGEASFTVHQVRKMEPAILHMGSFSSATAAPAFTATKADSDGAERALCQSIDVDKRILHSRIHTAGHVIGLAVHALMAAGALPPNITDGKASHYPSAAFVEFAGLIPGEAKAAIQRVVDDMVAQDLPVSILFWDEDRVKKECKGVGGGDAVKGDEIDGVRVVRIGDLGSYPCGGTHVLKLGECGKVVVRGVKRQKGVSKVSYEVQHV
ncbi:alanyl-tRNA synthetase-like protein [Stemphylium lycopersici]|uniref:Alanyl-tRNA synthetase-like protein n=1 Tax=Stemphylium lycopersici TaxID=183478 RepID=A0A364MVZ9_STELY|nr:alanyl-trna synthetase [Stemphylium lycopersici]RAR02322.1 alanyl-tRNA synthetase-like protein [Stemphylium lycopersici]RAR04874.1 alanyl-tRNA synthetase-like protein [Stemphylium lycopersici]